MKLVVSASISCVLAACSGGSSATPPATPFFVCPALVGSGNLVYPARGATGIVDSQNVVVVSAGLDATTLTLTAPSGQEVVSTTIVAVPSPLPSPNSPPQSFPTAFQIPTLAPATRYTVSTSGTTRCDSLSSYGSFTTQ